MKTMLLVVLIAATPLNAAPAATAVGERSSQQGPLGGQSADAPLQLAMASAEPQPVLGPDDPGAADNKYGFEGGSVVKEGGTYHLFVAEMAGDPFWVKMRLAHWQSTDARHWQRIATLYETPGTMERGDNRFSLWAPMPVFNEAENRWDLFYIAYRPGSPERHEGLHLNGQVWRAVSTQPGRAGIAGPYRDVGIVLQPDAQAQPWEGQQGTDSFYPWRVGGHWVAFYGSHNHVPPGPWLVGLAEAPTLAGPWTRRADSRPSPIEPKFIENPIVARIGAAFVAVYDSSPDDANPGYVADGRAIGYSVSSDGLNWPKGRLLDVQPTGAANWSDDVRTPLCLVPEDDGTYTVLYTAKLKGRSFWAVGLAHVRVVLP